MAEHAHNDPSKKWLIFFFVCFTMTVGAIGLWAAIAYHVDDTNPPAPGGGHGMVSPEQIPHANNWLVG